MLSTLMLSFKTYAEWTMVAETIKSDKSYIDFERIRKVEGYVYWWELTNYNSQLAPDVWSGIKYKKGDCKLFRYKYLSDKYFSLPMGKGDVKGGSNIPDKNWRYAPPKSAGEKILKSVCSR